MPEPPEALSPASVTVQNRNRQHTASAAAIRNVKPIKRLNISLPTLLNEDELPMLNIPQVTLRSIIAPAMLIPETSFCYFS